MRGTVGTGYLARIEANRVGVRAAPGAVFLRLIRDFAAEGQSSCMFTEMTPAEAQKLVTELQVALQAAFGLSLSPAPS